MSLIKADEVLTKLGLDDKYREQVDALIPGAIDQAFATTKNYFKVYGQSVWANDITFSADDKTIVSTSTLFINNAYPYLRFTAGLTLRVEHSAANDGIFNLAKVENKALHVGSTDILYDEPPGLLVMLSLCKIPQSFKDAIVQYIKYLLEKKGSVQSERIGNYSATFKSDKDAIKDIFRPFYKVRFV